MLEHRHPTGDTGTGAVIGTRSTRTAQDLVVGVANVSAAETDKTAEATVGEGAMVQTPNPPTKTDRKPGAVVRTDAEEVGRRRRDDGLMGTGTSVGPAIRRPQEKVGPSVRRPQAIVAHRTAGRRSAELELHEGNSNIGQNLDRQTHGSGARSSVGRRGEKIYS